jgi:hypothetical protein
VARVEFDMETEVQPERVIAGLTTFTEDRPELWPGLKAKEYRVYELGETSAVVREGSGGQVWAKERYDWSRPGFVRWEVIESGFCTPGSYVQAEVAPSGGGSRIHVTWQRQPTTLLARVMLGLIVLTRGGPVKASLKKGLDRIGKRPA